MPIISGENRPPQLFVECLVVLAGLENGGPASDSLLRCVAHGGGKRRIDVFDDSIAAGDHNRIARCLDRRRSHTQGLFHVFAFNGRCLDVAADLQTVGSHTEHHENDQTGDQVFELAHRSGGSGLLGKMFLLDRLHFLNQGVGRLGGLIESLIHGRHLGARLVPSPFLEMVKDVA